MSTSADVIESHLEWLERSTAVVQCSHMVKHGAELVGPHLQLLLGCEVCGCLAMASNPSACKANRRPSNMTFWLYMPPRMSREHKSATNLALLASSGITGAAFMSTHE